MRTEPNKTTTPVVNSRQVIGLDVVRFVAAVLVVAYHFAFWENVQYAFLHKPMFTLLEPYVCHGYVEVDIFFVLSGVVIAYSVEHSTAVRFVKSRVLRLYPAVWICSTLTLFALLLNHAPRQTSFHYWVNSIVLSPSGPWVDGSYWTLGIEMSFYALLFLLLLANRIRYIALLMTVIGLLSSGLLVFSYAAWHEKHLTRLPGAALLTFLHTRTAYLLLLRHGPLFSLGVFLWLCFVQGFTTRRVIGIVVFFAGSILAVHMDWADIVKVSGRNFPSSPSLLLWLTALIMIVLSLAYNQQITRAVGLRGASLARAAGLATYPLYLIHQQLGDIVIHHLYPRISYPAAITLCFCALLTFSFAVVPYLERPLQRSLKALLKIPRRTLQPSASLP